MPNRIVTVKVTSRVMVHNLWSINYGTNRLQNISQSPIILSVNSVGSIMSGSAWHRGSRMGFGVFDTQVGTKLSESSASLFFLANLAPMNYN